MDRDAKTKRCSVCERVLPVEDFYKRNDRSVTADRPVSKCKTCFKKTREQNRQKNLAQYKLTPAQFDEMLAAQGGGCAICGADVPGSRSSRKRSLAVDHDHTTGLVRGILCSCCNTGLGMFKDDPERLLGAIRYLAEAKQGQLALFRRLTTARSGGEVERHLRQSPRRTLAIPLF